MLSRHTMLHSFLILAAFFVLAVQAEETIGVDPGPIGGQAYDFAFDVSVPMNDRIILEFFDNKTLKSGPGKLAFMFRGVTDKNIPYNGVLLDASGAEIVGTEFSGVNGVDGAEIDLPAATVWSGMLFKDSGFLLGPHWLVWLAGNPVVGDEETPPEPPIDPPPAANISNLVMEGETLADGTVLSEILTGGGLAINLNGLVVFHGRNGDRIDGLFTQNGVVVLEGQTLSDGVVVDQIGSSGGVAINDGNQVAFLGKDDGHDEAAFTQAERLVKQDDTLPGDGTVLDDIRDRGRVAINNTGLIAFHGQSGEGLFSTTIAVFTQDNRIAAEGETLPDGTIVSEIRDVGGVAINEFGVVAFHGRTVGADVGGEKVSAVLTQQALVAKLNTTLPDGNVVTEIRERGRVAINVFSQVAFQGRVVDAAVGTDAVPAVFTSDGLVVNVGDLLSGGGTLEEISEEGGVAINLFAQVAFHGRTDQGIKAVFISDGLTTSVVAKEGNTLPDGTTLDEITDTGGVAVNLFGDVVFHGRTAGVDSVFVGSQGDTAP